MDITTLNKQLDAQKVLAKNLYAEMETKAKDPATYNPGEYTEKLDKIVEDGEAIVKQIDLARRQEGLEKLQTEPEKPPTGVHTKGAEGGENRGFQPQLQRKSWGQIFVESKEYREAAERGLMQTQKVNVKAGEAQYSAGGSTVEFNNNNGSYGGALIPIDRRTELADRAPYREVVLLDVIGRSSTTSDTVQYPVITSKTNNAAVVPERNTGDTDFGTKPQSSLAFDIVEETVKTIAHWIPASRQVLMDAARLRTEIDNFLGDGLQLKLEEKILSGAADSSTDFLGITNNPGIQSRVHKVSGRGFTNTDTIFDTLRRALTDIRLAFFKADAILMHPSDAESMELLKNSQLNYLAIYDPLQARVWRTQVIESQVITAGTAVVGNWKQGCTLWDRMMTEIRIGEPNDYFLKNAVAILAELRCAFGVIYPQMFEKVTALNT